MNASRWTTAALAFALLGACSKAPSTPAEHMAAADAARDSGEHEEALALYGELLDWKGEGTVGDGQRFKAALESVKCRIAAGDPKAGVDEYKEMYGKFPKEMGNDGSYKHTLAVLTRLGESGAEPMIAIDLLEVAKEKHPAQHENFAQYAKKLASQGLDDDARARLKSLGYL